MMLTQEYLKEQLRYFPETGRFWWVRPDTGRNVNRPAGSINGNGYRLITIQSTQYKASRLAFLYMTGRWPEEVDHKDRNKANDAWDNLREVTSQVNMQNKGMYRNNTSGIPGVSWYKKTGMWQASICCNYKRVHLGYYHRLETAIKAREKAEAELWYK